ncbi:unnamed protein product [Nezara viridula]|uniref:Uncharacterized protein n=1 Tax=Nezara viridula TaxID=85310 RepID=A0A9P0E2U0_NEZVI|nr:unnamed protein product [Nezara viridula]
MHDGAPAQFSCCAIDYLNATYGERECIITGLTICTVVSSRNAYGPPGLHKFERGPSCKDCRDNITVCNSCQYKDCCVCSESCQSTRQQYCDQTKNRKNYDEDQEKNCFPTCSEVCQPKCQECQNDRIVRGNCYENNNYCGKTEKNTCQNPSAEICQTRCQDCQEDTTKCCYQSSNNCGLTCKTRWNNIRDNFHKTLTRNETKGGKIAKQIKMHQHADQLNLPKKYLEKRETKGSIEYEKNIIETTEREEANTEDFAEKIETDSENVRSPSSSVSIVENPNIINIREKNVPESSAFQTAVETRLHFIDQKENEVSSSDLKEQEAVDAFLRGIAPALKTLSPYQWHLAKSELFATVQKFEEALFAKQQTLQCQSSFSGPLTDTSLDQPDALVETKKHWTAGKLVRRSVYRNVKSLAITTNAVPPPSPNQIPCNKGLPNTFLPGFPRVSSASSSIQLHVIGERVTVKYLPAYKETCKIICPDKTCWDCSNACNNHCDDYCGEHEKVKYLPACKETYRIICKDNSYLDCSAACNNPCDDYCACKETYKTICKDKTHLDCSTACDEYCGECIKVKCLPSCKESYKKICQDKTCLDCSAACNNPCDDYCGECVKVKYLPTYKETCKTICPDKTCLDCSTACNNHCDDYCGKCA